MNDRYGAFDGNASGYQGAAASTAVAQQQQQQRYRSSNGPCMDGYDPTRMINMSTYNPTARGTARTTATHQTLMPSNAVGVPSPTNGLRAQGFPDFEPIPLSTAALHHLTHSPTLAHSNSHAVARSGAQRGVAPISDLFLPPGGPKRIAEPWLEELQLTISGLSLEPLSGTEVAKRVENRTEEVITRYLPCVDFLVACQQELRKGLIAATTKRLVHHMFRDAMTPRQFYVSYIANLPERFYRKNRRIMKSDDLAAAVKELQKLCADARAVESQGCEVVKNTFLGGMKDGESWGLRKWLSKHGGALHICNDCECVLHACQKLDRSSDSTRKLSQRLRPLAKKSMNKLKAEVPASYQEHSSAHPYLPFFHRLEAALRGMSTFDPEDDDVVCIDDDDEVEELKAKAAANLPSKTRKRAATSNGTQSTKQNTKRVAAAKPAADGSSDEDSVIEILDIIKPAKRRKGNNGSAAGGDDADYMKALLNTFEDDASTSELFDEVMRRDNINFDAFEGGKDAFELASGLDRLAVMFEENQQSLVKPASVATTAFWDESYQYTSALRLFSEILRTPDSSSYLESVNEDEMTQIGNPSYSAVVKHPLCFREIVVALMEESDEMDTIVTGCNGQLSPQGLSSWNMWRGNELLEAIDLVLLNSLAYGKAADEGRSDNRSKTNKLRKILWVGIKKVIDARIGSMDAEERRRSTPTRRGESSGFVVYKDRR